MHIYFETADWGAVEAENLALFLFEGETADVFPIDRELKAFLNRIAIDSDEFKGEELDVWSIYREGKPARLFLLGLGKKEEFTPEKFRRAVGRLVDAAQKRQQEIFLAVRDLSENGLTVVDMVQAAVESVDLALYRFDYYRTREKEMSPPRLESLVFWCPRGEEKALRAAGRKGIQIAEAANLARDLANHPANVVTPTKLAAKAKEMETELGIETRIYSRRQMQAMGMGALLAVASGSREEPKLIVLEYGKKHSKNGTVALVGKGVTFDSGGISIKPSKNMDEMKYDMAGGAAVFGLLWAVARLEIPLHIVGVVPATENLPGGGAYKPGDVVTSFSGQTIEVLNTDAEGRLILADALTFAQKEFHPELLIDLATLTGAAVVALGHAGAAVMGNADEMIQKVQESAVRTGEKVWPIPLWEEYHDQLKSSVADMKNIGGGPGGLPVAGAFLENFIEKVKWVHIDIAGVAWTTEKRPYLSKGATGFGVRLLADFLQKMAEKQ